MGPRYKSDESEATPQSKSQRKRDALALQKLGERLLALGTDELAQLDIPVELEDALRFAHRLKKHGARRRQLQYIGALMREIDPTPIQRGLDRMTKGLQIKNEVFRQAERWRDELCSGSDAPLATITDRFPEADLKHLQKLVQDCRREQAASLPSRSARQLFRYLRSLLEESEL